MMRSILKHMEVLNYLWEEAVQHSTYIINRVAMKPLENKNPYEAFKGRKPSIKHLQVFGCIGYTKNEATNVKKLDDRSQTLVYLGTEPGSKAYRVLETTSRRIIVS